MPVIYLLCLFMAAISSGQEEEKPSHGRGFYGSPMGAMPPYAGNPYGNFGGPYSPFGGYGMPFGAGGYFSPAQNLNNANTKTTTPGEAAERVRKSAEKVSKDFQETQKADEERWKADRERASNRIEELAKPREGSADFLKMLQPPENDNAAKTTGDFSAIIASITGSMQKTTAANIQTIASYGMLLNRAEPQRTPKPQNVWTRLQEAIGANSRGLVMFGPVGTSHALTDSIGSQSSVTKAAPTDRIGD